MAPRIAVVGSANTDLITFSDAFPRPGETIFGQNFDLLVNDIEIPKWTFWVLGVGLEIGAAIGLFVLMKWRRWL